MSGARPVWMVHCSHNSGVVNTEAIRHMGFTDPEDLPDVEGGFVALANPSPPTNGGNGAGHSGQCTGNPDGRPASCGP